MNTANNQGPDGDRRAEVEKLAAGADAQYRGLKSPPLTPELRAWLDQQHTEEELIAWVREAREKGGAEFHEFLAELEGCCIDNHSPVDAAGGS